MTPATLSPALLQNRSIVELRALQAWLLYQWIVHLGSSPLEVSHKPMMVFAPHQDDETLGCGGLIAMKRRAATPVSVVFITSGDRSHPPRQIGTSDLIQTRRREALAALKVLGVAPSEAHFLDRPDGGLRDLAWQDRQQLVDRLAGLLRSYRPREVCVPHRRDGHPDHESTFDLVQQAIGEAGFPIEVLQYPIWINFLAPLFMRLSLQDRSGAKRLCIRSVQARKRQAIEIYRSQHEVLPRRFWVPFRSCYEIYFGSTIPGRSTIP